MQQLKGRTAVVTGAGSGIGRELAIRCAAEGMRLVLADIDEEAIAVTAALLPESIPVCRVRTDVSEADSVEALAEHAYAEFGEVGVLFNNAGVAVGGRCWESTLEDWKWILGVNLMGVVHGIRSFVPRMLVQALPGHVVNTSSAAGLVSIPGAGAYCATKHAVVTLSECLFHELGLKKAPIGVSVVCPSFVNTGIVDSERNRPAALKNAGQARPVRDPNLLRGMQTARLSAADVALITIDAIKLNSFYILSHRGVQKDVEERLRGVVNGSRPARGSLPSG
ncbi:MAG: SDR family NAD(P)-dependent oxidoreductase [Betaproteobacteria bacterium]|nr:SDR family NAD(P)-dependent oxidoreductase [Betaproteobacteria bacterium]